MINKKGAAISQIGILVLAIVAFAVVLNESNLVSAGDFCGDIDCVKNGQKAKPPCNKCEGLVVIKEDKSRDVSACHWESKCDPGQECKSGICTGEDEKKVIDDVKKTYRGVTTGLDLLHKKNQAEDIIKKMIKKNEEKITEEIITTTGISSTTIKGIFGTKTFWTRPEITIGNKWIFGEWAIGSGGVGHGIMVVGIYAGIALAAGFIARGISSALGASKAQSDAIGKSVGIGTFSGLIASSALGGGVGIIAGIAIAGILAIFTFKKESIDIAKYQCFAFMAEYGGNRCEECNGNELPCTEYQCNSLGQSCEIVNSGTEEELCVFVGRGDIEPPIISAWEEPLPDGYRYAPLTTLSQDRGVQVINPSNVKGCIPPFTDIGFGITLNEPSTCKISYERTPGFEEMGNEFFSRGVSRYNHSTHMTFPDNAAVEAEGYEYGEGINEMFVRCKDPRGNENVENFIFKFCVDETPDVAAPVIVDMDPLDESPIAFNRTNVDATFYLNKPSSCKWDRLDMSYEQMGGNMTCAESVGDAVIQSYRMLYPCNAALSGLQNHQENKFYIKCKSYPLKNVSEQIVMEQSYEYNLFGSRELAIISVSPDNETIRGSSNEIQVTLQVETFGGSDEGKALCSYSSSGNEGTYSLMYNTDSHLHSQEGLNSPPGDYEYYIRCADKAGNLDTANITFTTEADTLPPIIARVYNQDGDLRIITNEAGSCVYSVVDCTYLFEDGFYFNKESPTIHYTEWNTDITLYVKCKDDLLNPPLDPTECSIIVRPYDEFVESAF